MNANQGTGHSEATLQRIAALLLALADLAEQAGGRCFAVRVLVLLILRPAEAMARRLVRDVYTDLYGDIDMEPVLFLQDGDDATAAIRLALSLRRLAMALACLPDWALEDSDLQAAYQWLRLLANRINHISNILCSFGKPARPEVRAGLLSGVS